MEGAEFARIYPDDGARQALSTDAWEQRKLGEMADIVGGGTPSTGNPEYWDGDIDWYAPAEIAEQIYLESSQRKITELGYDSSSAKILPPGTVLFTSRAGIGKTAILARKGCTNQGFQSIVPHKGELDSYFIFSRTEELKRYGELVGAGSTFVEVSGKQMAAMELMIPSTMGEQQKIGTFFCHLDHLITLHQRKCDQLKKCILKRCLCRRKVVMGKIVLYHGSNVEVKEPKVIKSRRLLDFGIGFYLTSDYEQARKWAIRTTNRRENGKPTISVFDIEESELKELEVLKFKAANGEWLEYISLNRTNRFAEGIYDVVIGPVANDQAIRTVNNYLKGYFMKDIAIQLLLPQNLKDQYAFKTEKALSFLKFKEVRTT